MQKSFSVTSAGVNPAEDRAHRMRMYFIAMTLRVACVASLFWLRGWWVLLAAAGAVLLPWFAVMVGNAVAHNPGEAPDAPAPQQLEGGAPAPEPVARPADAVIVVDAEPVRRGADPGSGSGAAPGSGSGAGSGPGSGSGARFEAPAGGDPARDLGDDATGGAP
ncbi:DUF3099 domain-containing protein [Leucobacter luti]|uniref:DUF3099 domain-containing protein n=1 Tax=Leucobacter luti TaxID=340320 RepID=UPI003D04AC24